MRNAYSRAVRIKDLQATEPAPLGAHLVTRRFGYTHHGIHVGDGRVVHYAGFAGARDRGPVEEVPLVHFAGGRSVRIKAEPTARFAAAAVAERARSRLGENRYRVISNNCEHFCAWCVHGEAHSAQIEQLLALPRLLATLLVRLAGAVRALSESPCELAAEDNVLEAA